MSSSFWVEINIQMIDNTKLNKKIKNKKLLLQIIKYKPLVDFAQFGLLLITKINAVDEIKNPTRGIRWGSKLETVIQQVRLRLAAHHP